MHRKRQSAPSCSSLHLPKCLALLLFAEAQQLHGTATAALPGDGAYDASSIFSEKSVSRIVPLLREVEAALRLREAVSGWSAYYARPKIVVLRSAPMPLSQQQLLLRAAREAFATEERIHPGVFASHYRTLLSVVQAAFSMTDEPYDVLRLVLDRVDLSPKTLGTGEADTTAEQPAALPPGHEMFLSASHSAVTSAMAFVRDVQRLIATQ